MKLRRNHDYSVPLFLVPYWSLFIFFIALPVLLAIFLSFTYFNTVNPPEFIGLSNYVKILTQDEVFMRNVLPNTFRFAILVGPLAYIIQFLLAWSLAQISKGPRTILALLIFSPSLTAGITISIIWKVIFAGDEYGYLNNIIMWLGITDEPVQWLQSAELIMPVMIIVSLWCSMGVGFLSMLAGVLNVDSEIYEAGYIDGIKNRFQEIIYITIPQMRPQMMFGAVMSIVATFSTGQIGIDLTGANPTPQYAGQTMVSHIDDHGLLQYNMGYAAALSVVLLLIIYAVSRVANKLFAEKD